MTNPQSVASPEPFKDKITSMKANLIDNPEGRSNHRIAYYTSFNLAYLDRAIVMLRSVRRLHPAWHACALLVERALPSPDLMHILDEFDSVVLPSECIGNDHGEFLSNLNVVEACTSVKGSCLSLLLKKGFDYVIYLDPDVYLTAPLDTILHSLQGKAILLTPHVLSPASFIPAILDGELGSLKHGIFNLGFLGVANTEEGLRFANWWASRLLEACWERPDLGIYTDQRWCDLVPVLFSDVAISRDEGLNVASWNLSTRKLQYCDETYWSGKEKLKFYHFTKVDSAGRAMTDLMAGHNPTVDQLWAEYINLISQSRSEIPVAPKWSYQN